MASSLQKQLFRNIERYQPHNEAFVSLAQPFNAKITDRPLWFLRPRSLAQIQDIMHQCQDFGLNVSMRGAGFGVQSGTCSAGGVLLDPHYLKGLEVDVCQRIARVQAGVSVGMLDRHTAVDHLAAVAPRFARLPIVSVALGGGTGLLMAKHGFAAANITQAQLVTAKGQLVTVDAQTHPELLWALRGAGQNNFGIVTELVFNLHAIPRRLWGGIMRWPLQYAPQLMGKLSALLATHGTDLMVDFSLQTQTPLGPVCELFGAYAGPLREGQAIVQELGALAPHLSCECGETTYLNLQRHFELPTAYHPAFDWHHGFVLQGAEVELVERLVYQLHRQPELTLRVKLEPLGEAIQQAHGCLVPQQSRLLYVAAGLWETPCEQVQVKALLQSLAVDLHGLLTGTGHPNYHDTCIHNPAIYYFGEQAQQLQHLKQQWDPNGCFIGLLHPASTAVDR